MTGKLKAFGLAILTVAAINMVATSAAQAGVGELHIASGPNADITSELTESPISFKYTASGWEIQCGQELFEGTVPGQTSGQTTATELQVTPRYTGCELTAPLRAGATFDMNGCKYTLTGGETQLTAKVDIAGCTTGKQIQITTQFGCTIDVPEQGPLSHITFTNEEGGVKDIKAHITVQGIIYQFTGPFCPDQKAHSDGDYTGTETFKGFQDTGETVPKTHNGHQYNELVCGQQVGLFAT